MKLFLIGFFVAVYIFIAGEVYETVQIAAACTPEDERSTITGIFASATWPVGVVILGSSHLIFNYNITWICERKVTP